MANRRRAAGGRGQRSRTAGFVRFGTIPLVVIVLIIIIIGVDPGDGDQRSDVSSETETFSENLQSQIEGGNEKLDILTDSSDEQPEQEESLEYGMDSSVQEENLRLSDPSGYPLLQDAMTELTGLVRLYCEAKTECDPDLLAQIFGMEDWSEEQKSEEHARMELVKASIKSYENISCYSVQGPETDSYVIFPYYEIRYRKTETLFPVITWAYVKTGQNGQYYMAQDTNEEVEEYIKKVGEKPEVKAVMTQVQARQREAVDSDEVLQKIYGNGGGSEVIIE